MILVQNRLQPLSGNKLFLLLVLCMFLVSSCKTKKKVTSNQGPRTTTEQTNRPGPKSKVDTIRWTEEVLTNSNTGSVVTTQSNPEDLRSSYKITLLIPFESSRYEPEQFLAKESAGNRFANYYNGVKLALEKLEAQGANFTVKVLDSESGDFSSKLKNLTDQDVIIGPYNRDQLKETASFCRKNEIVNVSPWQASSKIASDNPFHLQLRPNQTAYYDAMLTDALNKYNASDIYMVGRDSKRDKGRINYFQKTALAILNQKSPPKPLNEYFVDVDSLINDAITYDSIFVENKTSVVLFPQWSSEDESFLYSCLRKLAIEKGNNNFVVYGMPIMIDSDKITYDFFQNLDIHCTRAKWVDKTDAKVVDFRRFYFQRYNALPLDDALDGYDMMMFIGSNLDKYGKTFQYSLDKDQAEYLQTSFDIQKVTLDKSAQLDNFNQIDYFENRKLDIVRFMRDRLVRD